MSYSPTPKDIVTLIALHSPRGGFMTVGIDSIATKVGLTPDDTRTVLNRLIEHGLAKRFEFGNPGEESYHITQEGSDQLARRGVEISPLE